MKQSTLLKLSVILLIIGYISSLTTIILGIILDDFFWVFIGLVLLITIITHTKWHIEENCSHKTSKENKDD